MFENQSSPPFSYALVNSMEELFDLIETDNFYPFLPNPSTKICRVSSPNDNEEVLNLDEWLIEDHLSCKIRPPKLYEFLRLLLNNPRYTSYASWLNEKQGMFKMHRPIQVADLWKKIKARKTNGIMDYDTLARGIRYYYKSGIMIKTYTRHTYCFAQI